MSFMTLFTLGISHQYYGDASCSDLDFVLANNSRQAMNGAGLLTRASAGKLHVLFEAIEGADGKMCPMHDIAGLELLIGLRLRNPCFEHITETIPESLPLYTNTAATLNEAQAGDLVERLFTPTAAMTQRPLTLSIYRTSDNALIWSDVVHDNKQMPTISMHDWQAGCYQLTQQSSAGIESRPLILAPELAASGMWGAINIKVAEDFWTHPVAPDFQITFEARKEQLSYYVVAPSDWVDFDKLSVTSSMLEFDKLEHDDFPQDGISHAQLGIPAAQAVLFRSQLAVARSANASLNIQLKRNEELLVKNLPLPSADMPSARFVVHLSKP